MDTSFRMYFSSNDPGALTIKREGAGDPLVVKEGMDTHEGKYYVEVTGIVAKKLDDMYDFTISNGTETATAHHGPLGYACWALSDDDGGSLQRQSLQHLMMALYHYNQSAKAYFIQQ